MPKRNTPARCGSPRWGREPVRRSRLGEQMGLSANQPAYTLSDLEYILTPWRQRHPNRLSKRKGARGVPRSAPRQDSSRDEVEVVQVRYKSPKGLGVDVYRLTNLNGYHQRLALEALQDFTGRAVSQHEAQRVLAFGQAGGPAPFGHASLIVKYHIKLLSLTGSQVRDAEPG
jgi:hypothetical protein